MTRRSWLRGSLFVGCVFAGCGSNPLAATWTASPMTAGASMESVAMTLGAGGDVSIAVTFAGCSGTMTYTGITWTSDATHLVFAGNAYCSGSATCAGGHTIDCANGVVADVPQGGSCGYVLSADGTSLSVTGCLGIGTAGAATYMRQM